MKKMTHKTVRKQAPVEKFEAYIGLDLGGIRCHFCELDADGDVVEEGTVRSTEAALSKRFGPMARARIVIESGPSSRWIDELLKSLGHDVIVANPRKVKAIFGNENKCDKVDAEMLARLGRTDPKLLSPVTHRSQNAQAGLRLVRSRDIVVRNRSMQINTVRGQCKAAGVLLPPMDSACFAKRAKLLLPENLLPELEPLLDSIGQLSEVVARYDRMLQERADELAPAARKLTQVPGVGLLTAVTFVLTIDDAKRFENSRKVASYLGLRPGRDQSCGPDKELPITKCGDRRMRYLLVQCANVILKKNGADTELRRWGLQLAGTGKNAKKRAVVAVARKLAVLLHRLWVTGRDYDPNWYSAWQTANRPAGVA
jgi:transposase